MCKCTHMCAHAHEHTRARTPRMRANVRILPHTNPSAGDLPSSPRSACNSSRVAPHARRERAVGLTPRASRAVGSVCPFALRAQCASGAASATFSSTWARLRSSSHRGVASSLCQALPGTALPATAPVMAAAGMAGLHNLATQLMPSRAALIPDVSAAD
eukprot:6175825-Pleurochrysis_carterae.AAC.2